MKKTLLLIILLYSTFSSLAQSKSGFKNTWVFMVGVLEWKNHENFASFDKTNRIDAKIIKFFQKNGLPNDHILYLKDKAATTPAVKEAFISFLKKAGKNDDLFFNYCGHGYRNKADKVCFANYEGADWSVEEIVKTVDKNFAGNTAIFTSDACNSGALVKEVQKYKNRNYAALASVVPQDLSTGNWTHSNALLYGLQGKNFVDKNNNGTISLQELAEYIDEEMAIVEGQKSHYYVPESLKSWAIAANIPKKKDLRIGEKVNVKYGKTDYLGFITNAKPDGMYKVLFYSYANDESEWLPSSRLVSLKIKPTFPVGSNVKSYCIIEKGWFPAKILKTFSTLHYVHYDGYDKKWDEWVSPDLVKKLE
jgi:RNA binding activity-knot of a chromodomain/Peptidase family C25